MMIWFSTAKCCFSEQNKKNNNFAKFHFGMGSPVRGRRPLDVKRVAGGYSPVTSYASKKKKSRTLSGWTTHTRTKKSHSLVIVIKNFYKYRYINTTTKTGSVWFVPVWKIVSHCCWITTFRARLLLAFLLPSFANSLTPPATMSVQITSHRRASSLVHEICFIASWAVPRTWTVCDNFTRGFDRRCGNDSWKLPVVRVIWYVQQLILGLLCGWLDEFILDNSVQERNATHTRELGALGAMPLGVCWLFVGLSCSICVWMGVGVRQRIFYATDLRTIVRF